MASIINSTDTGSGGLITTGDSSDELQLQTAETTAITITSGQQSAFIAGTASAPAVTTTGDLNTGIYFPAADNIGFTTGGTIRGRWTTDGLCFGTDTAAANALSDYEEGTWTPTIIGGTTAGTASYTQQVGNYTKIGRVVYIRFTVEYNSGTGTGILRISGLPFTVNADTYPLSIQADNLTLPANHYVQAVAVSTLTEIGIQSTAVGTTSLNNVSYDASAFLRGEGFYFI